MNKEIWKDVKGYVGLYQISNLGRVKSLPKRIPRFGGKSLEVTKIKYLKHQNHNAYPYVNLYKNKKSRRFSIHRLIAIHFIPNPENKPQVNHIDEDPANYSISNLEWVTPKENMHHSFDKIYGSIPAGENNKAAIMDDMKVLTCYTLNKNHTSNQSLSVLYGVGNPKISQIRNGRVWKHLFHCRPFV